MKEQYKAILFFLVMGILFTIIYLYQTVFIQPLKYFFIFLFLLVALVPHDLHNIFNTILVDNYIKKVEKDYYASNRISLTRHSEFIILQNQKNECYYCKKPLRKYKINSFLQANILNTSNLSNYYALCIKCHKKRLNKHLNA